MNEVIAEFLRDRSEKHSLLTDESIEAWIAEHEPDGAAKLLRLVQLNHLTGVRARHVTVWFERNAARAQAAKELQDAELRRREVAAAERSAKAAEAAADSSDKSARYAALSALAAAVALIVSVWPSIENLLARLR
jgi:hypothetical protein